MSSPLLFGSHIDKHDAGLRGVEGAEVIVKLLRENPFAKHLILGHNELQDEGCVLLFDYLRSQAGRRHQITEISLNANKIGDTGLWAIARYLEVAKSLEALFLQNVSPAIIYLLASLIVSAQQNSFQGDLPILLRFVLSINQSNLRTLSLACNSSLADAINAAFLPNLSSARLSELHLSVCSLGPTTTDPLLSYLTSARSQSLHILKLNGNPLGIASVTRIVNTLERANWSIGWLEMHACWHTDPADDDSRVKVATQLRIKVLERNRYLRRKVEEEALALLPYARTLLLRPERLVPASHARLPPELLLYILSFVAPSLSTAQHLRVSSYAASKDTLPPVGLDLPHIQKSASLSRLMPEHTCVIGQRGFPIYGSRTCAACVCRKLNRKLDMSSRREQERKTWLNHVGCDRFEAVADPENSVYET